MLSSVSIKNFKSIESLTLDLSFAEGKAPNCHKKSEMLSFLSPNSKRLDRVVSIMNIYGANASGKSNIMQSLFCFKKILLHGMDGLPQDIFSVNKLKDLGDVTSIQLEFFIKKKKYRYSLSYNELSIVGEELVWNDRVLYSIKKLKGDFRGIEIEGFDRESLRNRFRVSCIAHNGEKAIQTNTFLSSIMSDLPSLNRHLSLVNEFIRRKMIIAPNNNINPEFSIDKLAKSNNEEDIKYAFNRISRFIKRLDIDIERFEYNRTQDILSKYAINENEYRIPASQNKMFQISKKNNLIRISEIESFHKNEEGQDVSFAFSEESAGTRLAFGLIGTILKVLDEGGVLFIDELDRSLHTLLLQSLIRIFKDKTYNRKGAQLISTLHNTDILENNTYKMSEFSFVNKNLKKGSFIKRLSDFEDIRNDMNFRDRYLNGLYSAIPYPYN
jgi:AAA15 family ATPase/GTPase